MYTDGDLVADGRMEGKLGPVPLNGTLYLGQEQDRLAGGTDAQQSVSGYIAQVSLHVFFFTVVEIICVCWFLCVYVLFVDVFFVWFL